MKSRHKRHLFGMAIATILLAACAGVAAQGGYLVYVGTYTGPQSKGIYVFRFQPTTGEATKPELAGKIGNPSWVTISPNRRFLYAVSEYNNDKSSLSSFRIDRATGKLTLLNTVPSAGRGAVFVCIDHTGKNALVANYNSGSVAVRRIREDGSLGKQTAFDQHIGPIVHAHSVYVSPDNRFALSADLGLGEIFVYRFDATEGTLAPNEPPFVTVKKHSGPRHLAFAPNGTFVYLISELAGTVTAFAWNGLKGTLTELQTINAIPRGFTGKNDSQEVQVSSDGRFLYASSGGPSTIAVFSINRNGRLALVEQVHTRGALPRDFSIDPTGSYLFVGNQMTNNIGIFRVNRKTGRLLPTGTRLNVGSPVCITFVSSN